MLFNLLIKYFYPTSSPSSPSSPSLENDDEFVKTNPIFSDEIRKVKLRPVQQVKLRLPYPTMNLQSLSNKQLNDIKSVRLRKTFTNPTQTVFEIRHPCLRELLQRRLIIY